MKKIGMKLLGGGFVVFLIAGSQLGWFASSNPDSFPKLPSEPDFAVSNAFDGKWVGRRLDESNSNMCERTTIEGHVVDGFVHLVLTYNGTSLKGWISESNQIRLYATHPQWDYRFSGIAEGNKIQGEWNLQNGPCHGTWFIEYAGKGTDS